MSGLTHYKALAKQARGLGITERLKKAALIEAILAAGATPVDGGQAKTPGSEKQFVTPGAIRCPRCGAADTEATSTRGRMQYRKCRRATCRKRFAVVRERE